MKGYFDKMKKDKNILLIIAFSLLFTSWHPYVPNLNKKKDNLKGPVKTVIEYIWNWGDINIAVKEYNKNGYIEKIRFYGLSVFDDSVIYGSFPDSISSLKDTNKLNLLFSNTYKYTASGKLKYYKRVNELKHKTVFFSQLYYDKNDSLIAIVDISNYEKDKIEKDSTNIYYNRQDSIIKKTVINSLSDTVLKETYVLNEHDKIKMIIKDYKKSDCVFVEKYIYDEKGKISLIIKKGQPKFDLICVNEIKSFIYNNENQKLIKKEYIRESDYDTTRHEEIFLYDTLDQKIEVLEFNYRNNIIDGFSKTTYNSHQDCIEWYALEYYLLNKNSDTLYNNNPSKENYEYTYDSYGNWITKKQYSKGKISGEDKRIIKYYE